MNALGMDIVIERQGYARVMEIMHFLIALNLEGSIVLGVILVNLKTKYVPAMDFVHYMASAVPRMIYIK